MKTFNLTDDQVEKIVDALENKIQFMRMSKSKIYQRLSYKTTKDLDQRKQDQETIDKVEKEVNKVEKIIDEIKATQVA